MLENPAFSQGIKTLFSEGENFSFVIIWQTESMKEYFWKLKLTLEAQSVIFEIKILTVLIYRISVLLSIYTLD